MRVRFPPVLFVDKVIHGQWMRQMAVPEVVTEGVLPAFATDRLRGFLFQPSSGGDETLIVPKFASVITSREHVLKAVVDPAAGELDLSAASWIKHPLTAPSATRPSVADVLKSWEGAFSYEVESVEGSRIGLRPPQLGAIHATHAHWAVSEDPATIVMPTGTGKTDTMISILVSAQCRRLLVIVPTDALRIQLANKFLSLGVLKAPSSNVLSSAARFPLVALLRRVPTSTEEVDAVCRESHVIVTTSSIAARCQPDVQKHIASLCSHLFIDEAHHAEAPTWRAFKKQFAGRRVLQFTATPFREDGQLLDGTIIFRYPLRKAQAEGYFQPIRFVPVREFRHNRADQAIAAAAISALRTSLDKGHILMARVDSIARAEQVFALYREYSDLNPVQLHTKMTRGEREEARRKIIAREARIIICVDMLGEGFDLPELKIAAFHDIRKSLAVTLQLAGRFTRARPDLGEAVFIANTADVNVQDELRKLYSRDPDWNLLLPELADKLVGRQVSLQEFIRGFAEFEGAVPLQSVQPATSAVVYRTKCSDWSPDNFRAGLAALSTREQLHYATNHAEHTLVVVSARRLPLPWTDVQHVYDWQWELTVVVWSPEQALLFINCSSNAGEYEPLARAIAGESVELVHGQQVFKIFAGVNRLRLQNVGLSEQLGRNVRYTGRMGADIEPALTEVQRRKATKSVLSGTGYEGGEKVTVGASKKGRIWSHRRERVDRLVAWCRQIGRKLLDSTVDPDDVIKGTLDTKTIHARPNKVPIGVDWPEIMYSEPESYWYFRCGAADFPLCELELRLASYAAEGNLAFQLVHPDGTVEIELQIGGTQDNPEYRFVITSQETVALRHDRGAEGELLEVFLYRHPPKIWFVDGSSLEGNLYLELRHPSPPFAAQRIEAWIGWGQTFVENHKAKPAIPRPFNTVSSASWQRAISSPLSMTTAQGRRPMSWRFGFMRERSAPRTLTWSSIIANTPAVPLLALE